jgi:hypothetical protein
MVAARASDLLHGRVLIEMYNAQLIGTWRRLKACHNARCHEVFFGQSKNNSRTWFDTACATRSTCAHTANGARPRDFLTSASAIRAERQTPLD